MEILEPASEKKKINLGIQELDSLSMIKLPNECWRDHKKLTKFLSDVELAVNTMVKMQRSFVN